jgi:uncharacterized membrane-anchored protein
MTASRRARRTQDGTAATVTGSARVDDRTKNLTKRLSAGDVAVVDHADLDQVSAHALVACSPAAVVNAAASTTGTYPNMGPQILLEAGIPVLDRCGPEVMTIGEGSTATVEADEIRVNGHVVARGVRLTPALVAAQLADARTNLSDQIEAFSQNTMDYVRAERELLIDGIGIPPLRTDFTGRYALVVVRGYHYKDDLHTLRPFIREARPVLIGVDGGADALLEQGLQPDLIVGDMDSVSDAALTSGAELVVHAYRDGRAPGLERLQALGIHDAVVMPAPGTSEDIAMLIADDSGAELIVAVGTHATLVEFLDKGRQGMASTFLTRLRIGSKLVDAKGVSLLYRSRISSLSLVWLVLAGLLALGVALAATPGGRALFGVLAVRWDDVWAWIEGVFG